MRWAGQSDVYALTILFLFDSHLIYESDMWLVLLTQIPEPAAFPSRRGIGATGHISNQAFKKGDTITFRQAIELNHQYIQGR